MKGPDLPNSVTKTAEQHIDAYLKEWLQGLDQSGKSKEELVQMLGNSVHLNGWSGAGNFVSSAGYRELERAAELLLFRVGEQRRLTQETAIGCLIQAHQAQLVKAQQKGTISEFAITAGAAKRMRECKRSDGLYVFPAMFGRLATSSNFRVGPVRLLSQECFQQEFGEAINDVARGSQTDRRFVDDWRRYSASYDHFLTVEIERHESEMAWKAAREAADFMLNLVRMKYGHYHTKYVRIGGEFILEMSSSQIVISKEMEVSFTSINGPWGSHLEDNWVDAFDKELKPVAALLSFIGSWITSGNDPSSPVLERVCYANALLSEAYSEPHDHIRIVRLVAALEALAVLEREDKAEGLAVRCSIVGSWGDGQLGAEILEAVRKAYRLRNEVVHGDAPSKSSVMRAFFGLEKHLLAIFVGFLDVLSRIQMADRPQSIQHLRRIMKARFNP